MKPNRLVQRFVFSFLILSYKEPINEGTLASVPYVLWEKHNSFSLRYVDTEDLKILGPLSFDI